MSLWSTLPPDEQLLTEPGIAADPRCRRRRTSGPTWPPTGGPGAGPARRLATGALGLPSWCCSGSWSP